MKEPSVFRKPKSPYWWCDFVYKKKRYQKAMDKNKKRAIQKTKELQTKLRLENSGDRNLWSVFKVEYFEWAKANKNAQTVYRDRLSLSYLEEFKPDIHFVTDITPALLDKFKAYLINRSRALKEQAVNLKRKFRGMGEHGINRTLQSVKVIARKAEAWGYFPAPQKWETISKIKTAVGRVVFHTAEELERLIDYCREVAENNDIHYCPYETVIMLGARAGLRRGEIQNLMWTDIDFERNIITIQPKEDWHPKTYECRDIPMAKDLREHLLSIPRRGPYVLYDIYGQRFSMGSLTNYYRVKIARKVGIDSFIHKLRHTYASHLVQNRVDLYTVCKLLGHKSIKTTEIYAHLIPDTLQQAVDRLPPLHLSVGKSVGSRANFIHQRAETRNARNRARTT